MSNEVDFQTMEREIEFLDGIKSGRWVRNPTKTRAIAALRGYLHTLDKRVWENKMDVERLRKRAGLLLDMGEFFLV